MPVTKKKTLSELMAEERKRRIQSGESPFTEPKQRSDNLAVRNVPPPVVKVPQNTKGYRYIPNVPNISNVHSPLLRLYAPMAVIKHYRDDLFYDITGTPINNRHTYKVVSNKEDNPEAPKIPEVLYNPQSMFETKDSPSGASIGNTDSNPLVSLRNQNFENLKKSSLNKYLFKPMVQYGFPVVSSIQDWFTLRSLLFGKSDFGLSIGQRLTGLLNGGLNRLPVAKTIKNVTRESLLWGANELGDDLLFSQMDKLAEQAYGRTTQEMFAQLSGEDPATVFYATPDIVNLNAARGVLAESRAFARTPRVRGGGSPSQPSPNGGSPVTTNPTSTAPHSNTVFTNNNVSQHLGSPQMRYSAAVNPKPGVVSQATMTSPSSSVNVQSTVLPQGHTSVHITPQSSVQVSNVTSPAHVSTPINTGNTSVNVSTPVQSSTPINVKSTPINSGSTPVSPQSVSPQSTPVSTKPSTANLGFSTSQNVSSQPIVASPNSVQPSVLPRKVTLKPKVTLRIKSPFYDSRFPYLVNPEVGNNLLLNTGVSGVLTPIPTFIEGMFNYNKPQNYNMFQMTVK